MSAQLRRNRGLLAQFEEIGQCVTHEDGGRFAELSRAGDRSGMIRDLAAALGSLNFTIGDHFRGKDEAHARQLLLQQQEEKEDEDGLERSAAILTEALEAAPTRSELFFEILRRRARVWCCAGDLARCAKDCRYFADAIARSEDNEAGDDGRIIEVLLMHSDCCKAMGELSECKNRLNEAMQRISELAGRQAEGCEDKLKVKKIELLKSFLQRKQALATKFSGQDNAFDRTEKIIPEVDGKSDKFLRACSDALTVDSDEVKGRMLRATRDIEPGSVLIVDRPFSFSTDIAALHRNCLNCHASLRLKSNIRVPCCSCRTVQFCSEECRQRAWDKFHKFECRIFDYFYEIKVQKTNALLAYRTVVTAALQVQNDALEFNQEFLKLHENDSDALNINTLRQYEPQDYKTVFSLETHCIHSNSNDNLVRAIYSVFFAKCLLYVLDHLHPVVDNRERHLHTLAIALLRNMQAINCNAYEIVENVRDDSTKILEPRNVGGAIYTSVSLTNHSCYPNVVRHTYPCGTVVVRSVRFIPQGSEILDCYGQHFLENKRDLRRKLLAQKYFFKCQCEACLYDWSSSLPSDQFNFKCKICSKPCRRTRNATQCMTCGQKTEISKMYNLLQSSIKKRLTALTKMYDGNYEEALPLLLEHGNCINKILSEPSLEAVKTQQSIIQCLNALSSTST